MLLRFRNHFGPAGLVVAIVALVVALTGGAYAATNSGGGKATASAKAKKGPRGPKGATGPAGPAGPAGAQGPAGPAGPKGDTGAAGKDGTNGTNGKDGKDGPEGSPWTDGGVLPSEATETGMWGSYGVATTGTQSSALSFTIPLANAPEAIFVDLNNEDSKPGCPGLEGGTEGVPTADEGKLCVYAQTFEEAEFTGIFTPDYSPGFEAYELAPGASKTGAIVRYTCQATFCSIVGPWAVTAE